MSGQSVENKQVLFLGGLLTEEASHAKYLDHVFCLAPFESGIEQWLGAKRATHIPRIISETELRWSPVKGRLGYVGRLDHPPNKEGLVLVLGELNKISDKNIELRIVGAPLEEGEMLSGKYSFVNYLGELAIKS